MFEKNSHEIVGNSDADWGSNVEDRRSISGYVFTAQGGAISWCSKRQPTIALSSNEAEYMALSSATQEALWWKGFREEIENVNSTVSINCDNRSAICMAENNGYSPRSKHIDIRHHFVREKIASGEIKLKYVPTNQQVADALTKAVPADKMKFHKTEVGMLNFH
jgi:hypothetical protein